MTLVIYTDGGARGNPGPAGAAVVIKQNGEIVGTLKKYLGDGLTNNYAEYEALYLGLAKLRELKLSDLPLEIRMDSELVVKQMKGEYRVKDAGIKLQYDKVKGELVHFKHATFMHIRREHNKEADALVNEALDEALAR